MADQKLDEAEVAVREHVRMILARISALKARLRTPQEQADQSGSESSVEIDREDDRAGGVSGLKRPS